MGGETEAQALSLESGATAPVPAKARPNRARVVFSFLAIWLVWGSTFLAIRYAVTSIPPLYAAGLRHLTAGTILALLCVKKGLRPSWGQVKAGIVLGTLFFLGGHGALHWAETRIPSGLASLLIATEPIFIFLLGCVVAKRWRVNAPLVAGVILGFSGVVLLIARDVAGMGAGMMAGAIAALGGSISWGSGVVYARRSYLSGSPLLLSAMSLLAGAVQLLILGTLLGESRGFSFSAVTLRSWLALAYLVIFGSVITFTAYNWLMEHYSPTLVATHTFINPLVAVLLGWALAGERVTLNTGIAAAMVIAAVILVDRGMGHDAI